MSVFAAHPRAVPAKLAPGDCAWGQMVYVNEDNSEYHVWELGVVEQLEGDEIILAYRHDRSALYKHPAHAVLPVLKQTPVRDASSDAYFAASGKLFQDSCNLVSGVIYSTVEEGVAFQVVWPYPVLMSGGLLSITTCKLSNLITHQMGSTSFHVPAAARATSLPKTIAQKQSHITIGRKLAVTTFSPFHNSVLLSEYGYVGHSRMPCAVYPAIASGTAKQACVLTTMHLLLTTSPA